MKNHLQDQNHKFASKKSFKIVHSYGEPLPQVEVADVLAVMAGNARRMQELWLRAVAVLGEKARRLVRVRGVLQRFRECSGC